MNNIQNGIKLIESLALSLWQEEKGPAGRDQHPDGKEEPGAEAKRCEDVRKGLGDDELDEPIQVSVVKQNEDTERVVFTIEPWLPMFQSNSARRQGRSRPRQSTGCR